MSSWPSEQFSPASVYTPLPPLFLANSAIVISLSEVDILREEISLKFPQNAFSCISLIFYTLPLFPITISIRFGIERIKLFTVSTGME